MLFTIDYSNINLFIGIIILIISIIILLKLFYFRKKKVTCQILIGQSPQETINNIINAFYYANMHNKQIHIILYSGEELTIDHDQHIMLKSIFNTILIKFLLHSSYTHLTFFINKEGLMSIILYNTDNINWTNKLKFFVLLSYINEKNVFTIETESFILKENSSQKTISILKEIIKRM